MPRKAAVFFSVILHPILMPLVGISLLIYSGSFISFMPPQTKKAILLIFFAGTFVLPLLMILLLWFRGVISDLHLDERSERIFPYAMTLAFYLFTYFLILRIPGYRYINIFMLGGLLSLVFLLILNFRWKISAHMTGIGGIIALILAISFRFHINLLPILIIAILASGILATSRLIIQAHTPAEIYAGFLCGFAVMLAVVYFH